MIGNNGNSKEGPKHSSPNNFGVVKNQGRNAFANESAPTTRSRANATTEAPSRNRANAMFEPATRARSNPVFGAPEGFGKIRNEGRQNAQPSNNGGFGLKEQMQNLGRAAFAKNPDRSNLNFSQKTGFNLMAGFMDRMISEANKPNPGEANQRPGFLQPPGNTGFNANGENDNRRLSMQAQHNNQNDDSNVTAGEFFKRLQTALQDPAKFKREALQKEQARANQQHNQPQNQQQRQQSGAPQQQQPTAQDFFKELRGALKDPAAYKRRVEAQQKQQQRSQPQNQPQPGKNNQPQEAPKAKPSQASKPKPRPKSPRK